MKHEKLYTIVEVARKLRLSRWTVYTHIKAGKLRATKVGRVWRIKRSDYEGFLEAPPPDMVDELTDMLMGKINVFLQEHRDCGLVEVHDALTRLQDYVESSKAE